MNVYFLINININVKITIVIIKIKIQISYPILKFILHSKSRLTNLLARTCTYTDYCYVCIAYIFKFFLLLFSFGINFTTLLILRSS